jgi:cystathionine gamma-synthase
VPLSPATVAARADFAFEPVTGALVPPIQPATTYARDDAYALRGARDYTRDKNPTPEPVERTLAALEGGADAMAFGSGMAAATAVFRALLRRGDHVVAPEVGYYSLRAWLRRFGDENDIDVTLVDGTRVDRLIEAIRPGRTAIVWLETPANPTWAVTDIEAASIAAHAAGALVCVDSTCATPVHSRPLALGADIVMHSATKYLNGHGDVLAGMLVTSAIGEPWQAIRRHRNGDGACLGPFEAWLLQRGMRTLFVRVERQSATALGLARRLEATGVATLYPGLPSHPQHAVAARQMIGGFGGMLSIRTGGGAARAIAVATRLRLFAPATSLGSVDSLVEHRATVEGPSSPVPDDLLRLSIGLEDEVDLWADLERALGGA